jgi:hypothetical protein
VCRWSAGWWSTLSVSVVGWMMSESSGIYVPCARLSFPVAGSMAWMIPSTTVPFDSSALMGSPMNGLAMLWMRFL